MAEKKAGGGRKEEGAKKKTSPKSAAKSAEKRPAAKKAAAKPTVTRAEPNRIKYEPREARAIQRTTRQSPYKMRLVIDQIRGQSVNDALALLTFSKKHAAKQIEKVVRSAVANAEHAARNTNASLDVDDLFIKYAVINEGPKLKRWTPAAMGRATPMLKRTSHVEIVVAERPEGR
jgi:large subunit ribosomal protein L22